MKLTEQNGLRILTPDEGQWLYKDDQTIGRIFSYDVYLGINDSPANWGECTNEEKEQWEQEHSEQQDEQEQPTE